jgi:hypothetical protein
MGKVDELKKESLIIYLWVLFMRKIYFLNLISAFEQFSCI